MTYLSVLVTPFCLAFMILVIARRNSFQQFTTKLINMLNKFTRLFARIEAICERKQFEKSTAYTDVLDSVKLLSKLPSRARLGEEDEMAMSKRS